MHNRYALTGGPRAHGHYTRPRPPPRPHTRTAGVLQRKTATALCKTYGIYTLRVASAAVHPSGGRASHVASRVASFTSSVTRSFTRRVASTR